MEEVLNNTVEQIYTKCLAQGAYFIESNGEAIVIDPLRETDPYLERAAEKGVKIKYIFETHFHADFVSGHLSLAKKTGATIVYGPGAKTDYDKHTAKDGEVFNVGDLTITVLHTPGHTPESSCFLLKDATGKEQALFTGDTLFIGDVGRPDLAQESTGLTSEDLAGWLFDSLRNKIMPLPDDVVIYPAHGAGSACGKNMSSETTDTLGNQKATNYALDANLSREDFVKILVDGLSDPPSYFKFNASINKRGYRDYDKVMEQGFQGLTVETFESVMNRDEVLVLDIRDKMAFGEKHIPGSLSIGIDGSFAPWVGEMITDINQKIVLVAPVGREEEAVKRLSRVGYDQCLGYLEGSIEAWSDAGKEVDSIKIIDAKEFGKNLSEESVLIDFRKPSEFALGHVSSAKNIPLSEIHDRVEEIENNSKDLFIHCRSGYRSTIAASILKQNGLNPINIVANVDDIIDSSN